MRVQVTNSQRELVTIEDNFEDLEEVRCLTVMNESGLRIDKYLSEQFPDLSRSFLQKLIRDGAVFVDLRPVKANYRISYGERVEVHLPEPSSPEIEPENIPLDILYEDNDVLVINKPKDMVVHPSAGHFEHTVVNAVMYHCKDQLSGINGVMRPGIVHRIDKDTTGAIVICKNDHAHQRLAEQLKEHSITRKYHAIVYNNFPCDEGIIDAPIGRSEKDRKKMAINHKKGKPAVTHYKILERFHQFTYVECTLETGRTHQIRVHMASISHPLLGDQLYGPDNSKYLSLQGQVLHARVLGFIHPTTGLYMEFEAPMPEYFEHLLKTLSRE